VFTAAKTVEMEDEETNGAGPEKRNTVLFSK
jgi:hypothetical protein